MEPHSFPKMIPDPHLLIKLDPDPYEVNADPKHCTISLYFSANRYAVALNFPIVDNIMETLLEQQRRYHEERERLMDAMVQVGEILTA
jgi:hypothetical protein